MHFLLKCQIRKNAYTRQISNNNHPKRLIFNSVNDSTWELNRESDSVHLTVCHVLVSHILYVCRAPYGKDWWFDLISAFHFHHERVINLALAAEHGPRGSHLVCWSKIVVEACLMHEHKRSTQLKDWNIPLSWGPNHAMQIANNWQLPCSKLKFNVTYIQRQNLDIDLGNYQNASQIQIFC